MLLWEGILPAEVCCCAAAAIARVHIGARHTIHIRKALKLLRPVGSCLLGVLTRCHRTTAVDTTAARRPCTQTMHTDHAHRPCTQTHIYKMLVHRLRACLLHQECSTRAQQLPAAHSASCLPPALIVLWRHGTPAVGCVVEVLSSCARVLAPG